MPRPQISFDGQQRLMRAIDLFVGMTLIISAFLKSVSPTESATLASAYGLPVWISFLLIQCEAILGVLLITNLAGHFGRIAALAAFVLFACFSAHRALAGYESCGCFGAIAVHPWITFTVDLMLIALLTWSVRRSPVTPPRAHSRVLSAAAFCLLLGGTALGLSYAFQPQVLASDDDVAISDGGLVILEPETWRGKPLPITKYISPSVDLSHGDWTLLLYHHDCPKCQKALPRYQDLADEFNAFGSLEQVLLVEVPPFGRQSPPIGAAQAARLSDEREWFVQAPVEIRMREGRVVQSSLELPALTEHVPRDVPLSHHVTIEP